MSKHLANQVLRGALRRARLQQKQLALHKMLRHQMSRHQLLELDAEEITAIYQRQKKLCQLVLDQQNKHQKKPKPNE